jgi:sugar (pentulose or hexulose) kinase
MWILGVDIGTTSLKMGVFELIDGVLRPVRQFAQAYDVNIYNDGLFGDIEPDKWRQAFTAGCRTLADAVANVEIISLSGTTPGLTPMDRNGDALHPAILMLDQRSHRQARRIIDTIGLDRLLATTANMPVPGGCSLASILWLKDNLPDLFRQTHKFGHSNTWFAHWLTGAYAIDPSSASLTALYRTVRNDYTWDEEIARAFGLALDQLPPLVPAWHSVGTVRSPLARKLGMAKNPQVLIGGNDAVLAAYSVGVKGPGEIVNVNGTCEISLVCLAQCLPSPNYNIRAHVLPHCWLTLHVMNAGGKALEWFKNVFCGEMTAAEFYDGFVPRALDAWLDRTPPLPAEESEIPNSKSGMEGGSRLPGSGPGAESTVSTVTYIPWLMGSRYSLEPLRAGLLGLNQTTTREEILAAIVRGLCEYQRTHLREIERHVPLQSTIHLTGGAVSDVLIRAKRKWMRDGNYVREDDSSVKGAALLARLYLEDR